MRYKAIQDIVDRLESVYYCVCKITVPLVMETVNIFIILPLNVS